MALAAYWLWFDRALHTDNRYYMRTVLLVGTLALGTLAAVQALAADGRLRLPVPFLPRLMQALHGWRDGSGDASAPSWWSCWCTRSRPRNSSRAWTQYKAAVRALAIGTASDPVLGDAHFVSSDRIGADLNRLSWFSTTHFLSVLVAPGFAPARLVVDPQANYFSLSCATATANEEADRVVPVASRRLVRVYACLHRDGRRPGRRRETWNRSNSCPNNSDRTTTAQACLNARMAQIIAGAGRYLRNAGL